LSKYCPLPGIGIYTKGKRNDFSSIEFAYLKIKGMEYDSSTQMPYFHFETLEKSNTPSRQLIVKLPGTNKWNPDSVKLFSSIDCQRMLEILKELGENPPDEWMKLIETPAAGKAVDWRDYIGRYFLEIENGTLSDDEFEDRVYRLLIAIGFDVTQKGHTLPGAYPDGIASFEEYALVYDCKNSDDYCIVNKDKLTIKDYLKNEKKVRKEKKFFPIFITNTFGSIDEKDVFHFNIRSLNYLLYKKLQLGSKFNLRPIKKILDNKMPFNEETIDKEWKV
jgi:hypothetical protein